jgi:hypothetical protein
MKQIRTDREKLWYVVSHPFTRPVVTGPIHDRYDAIALACKRTDNKSLITHISRGESWVGGEVVCSAYRLHVNGWTALAPKKPDARLKKPSKYGRVT